MDERKVLKLGKRQKPVVARGIASGTQRYIPPSEAPDVVAREATDASIVAQRKKEKALRRKQLAFFMSKASGGSQAQFEKVINSEDWDDLDVQEMLLEDRFSRYREIPVVSTSDAVKAQIAQTNKNATTRKLEQIQQQKEFIGKQTGAISSNYEENAALLTPETVVAGKIKAAGLENELAGVLNKYDSYISMNPNNQNQSFSKEELSIFKSISATGLKPSRLTSKKSVLDFAGPGGSFDGEETDTLTIVEEDYAQDNLTPNGSLAAIFGAYRESLSGAPYDILPINKYEVSSDLLHNEFTLKAPDKYPEYMRPARSMKGQTVQEQQSEALGLPDNANVQEYFDNLAKQYIDPQKLEDLSPAEQGKAVRLLSMQISKMLPKRLKEISVQNATSIQHNDDQFNNLVEQFGIDEAVRLAGGRNAGLVSPTAAYNAYPSPQDLVGAINSSKLREFAEGVVKRGMTKNGLWTDDPEQADVMSTLLTFGTNNLTYNSFDSQDDEYQRATVARAALTELPKQLGRIYGISDSAVSRKSWEGGLRIDYEVLEKTLDEQLSEDTQDTLKPQLDRELESQPTNLDRYARDELARTVDVYFQPAGDLAADYKDNNLTQVDEYLELVGNDVELMDDDGSQDVAGGDDGGGPNDGPEEGSGAVYEEPTGLESYSREGPEVDDSFATAAPSVDMEALEAVREGAGTNQRAAYGDKLSESSSTTDATYGNRLGQSIANRTATPGTTPEKEFPKVAPDVVVAPEGLPKQSKTSEDNFADIPMRNANVKTGRVEPTIPKPKPTADPKPTPVITPIPTPPPIITPPAPPTPLLGTRAERLTEARIEYQKQNPETVISNVPQGGKEWLDDRKELVTASDAKRVVRSERARNTFVGEKAMENWGLTTTQPFASEDIERGHRLESKIRQQYEKQTDTEVMEMGLIKNQNFPGGASLDGLVTTAGKPTKRGVEFKAPREFRNFAEYHDQVQMQMAVGNLDSVDVVQGVEVDGKLRTQTQTVNKDLDWQKRNRGKIQQAQDSIARNAAMTQEEFLNAQATMAADKSGKYGFLISASKQDVEESIGGKKAARKGSGGGGGKGPRNNRVSADPEDRNPYRRKKPDDEDDEDGDKKGGKSRGFLRTAYETVKDVTQLVDRNSQDVAATFRDDIGKALDYGVNPGQYLSNNIALRGAGVSDRDARSATLSGASQAGAMELGDFSGAVSQVVGTLGLEDLTTKRELADNPTERALRIIKNANDRGMSPMATAEALRRSGLEGFGTLANLSTEEQTEVSEKTREQPEATSRAYATTNRVINQGAEVLHRKSLAATGVNAAISKDAGFAKKQLESMKSIPDTIGEAVDELGNSLTGITGGKEQSSIGQSSEEPGTYSGRVQRDPIDVNVTVKLEGNVATVDVDAGGKTASSQQSYHQSTVQ